MSKTSCTQELCEPDHFGSELIQLPCGNWAPCPCLCYVTWHGICSHTLVLDCHNICVIHHSSANVFLPTVQHKMNLCHLIWCWPFFAIDCLQETRQQIEQTPTFGALFFWTMIFLWQMFKFPFCTNGNIKLIPWAVYIQWGCILQTSKQAKFIYKALFTNISHKGVHSQRIRSNKIK